MKPRSCRTRDIYPTRRTASGALCCVCGKPLTGRARRYCSGECQDKALMLADPGYAADRIHIRDKGICAHCGINTRALHEALWSLGRWKQNKGEERLCNELRRHIVSVMAKRGWNTSFWRWQSLSHIHHIKRHADGGASTYDNLITLCIPCHKAIHKKGT